MRAPARLDGGDAVRRQGGVRGEEFGVFAGNVGVRQRQRTKRGKIAKAGIWVLELGRGRKGVGFTG